MIIDTENYTAIELQMFFNELENKLHTKQQYKDIAGISPEGIRKRLKSVYSPQTYKLSGVIFIELEVFEKEKRTEVEKPLSLIKFKLPF